MKEGVYVCIKSVSGGGYKRSNQQERMSITIQSYPKDAEIV